MLLLYSCLFVGFRDAVNKPIYIYIYACMTTIQFYQLYTEGYTCENINILLLYIIVLICVAALVTLRLCFALLFAWSVVNDSASSHI